MESQEEKYKQLLQEARSREEKFRKALLVIKKACAYDRSVSEISAIASGLLKEFEGGDLR